MADSIARSRAHRVSVGGTVMPRSSVHSLPLFRVPQQRGAVAAAAPGRLKHRESSDSDSDDCPWDANVVVDPWSVKRGAPSKDAAGRRP
jgi:hypothetical protein